MNRPDLILERQNGVEKRRKKLRRALNRLAESGAAEESGVADAVDEALPLPCDSFLEKLPDVALDAVVRRVLEIGVLESLAATSKTMREKVVRVRELNGRTRRALKERYEGGEAKRWGLNFFKTDKAAGRADIEEAARWGYRPAVARCKWRGWGCAKDEDGAVALWRAERASSPSEESGGPCIWSANCLACRYWDGGGGVERDYAKAVELFHEAADERGNSSAMNALASAYGGRWRQMEDWGCASAYGGGWIQMEEVLEVDEVKELKYYRSASDSGNATASGNLGIKHEYGHTPLYELGLDVNLAEAARLYEIAKEKDVHSAMWTRCLNRILRKIAAQ